MQVDQQRLRRDIRTNGRIGDIGAETGHGRTVLTGTTEDEEARRYLIDRMENAGLDVSIDPIGNIEGRWVPDGVDQTNEPVAAGSHLDSVPQGGIFDGPLGVYAALEAVRTIQENHSKGDLQRPLSVVSFTGEEGVRFKNGLLGSSVATGERTLEEAYGFEDNSGTTVREALDSIGFTGSGEIDPRDWYAWFEIHIEQDRTLEKAEIPVGIIEAITGMANCSVEITGEANHAGATAMSERTDALAAASEFILDLETAAKEVAQAANSSAVGTVGELHVSPNAKNVVAGGTDMIIDVRGIEYESMNTIISEARSSLERLHDKRGVETTFDRYRDQRPSKMAENCVNAAVTAATERDIDYQLMPSAAMHDTSLVAGVTDTAMLFAPSEEGISHNPREWTDWDDCAAAADVLAGAMYSLAKE